MKGDSFVIRFREFSAFVLMLVGSAVCVRGTAHSVRYGLGWKGIAASILAGTLVFFLGLARWRYIRERRQQ